MSATATIHPTAIIEGPVELGENVHIGPRCTIQGAVTIGAGTYLVGDIWIQGPVTIGTGNRLYPYTTIGFAPQARGIDTDAEGCGVRIGNDNVLREHVTVNRAMTDNGPTTIGNDNYIMAQCHAGHDVQIGNHSTLANSVHLGGHAVIEDRVTIGGGTVVHQFVRAGFGSMMAGGTATTRDVLPWFCVTTASVAASMNLVGMRRQGLTRDEIEEVRWVYKTLNRRGLSVPSAVEAIRERHASETSRVLDRMVEFLDRSERSICTAFQQRARTGYDVRS